MDQDRTYSGVYIILIVLTLLTMIAAQFQFARVPTILLALSIASVKATLIALYYMHLRDEKPLVYGIVIIGIVTASILFLGLFPDIGIGL